MTVIATATAGDAEMAERIARHRADRPEHWSVIEEPVDLLGAVAVVDDDHTIIVDCLALWLNNSLAQHLSQGDPERVLDESVRVAEMLAGRNGRAYVVSNEVGSGIVPADALTREFRDLLGSINQRIAERAESAFLCVSGQLLRLERVADFDV